MSALDKAAAAVNDEVRDRQRCSISISDHGIDFYFTPALPDEPHRPSRVEIMAAGALFLRPIRKPPGRSMVGMARALTGKGVEQVIHALAQFERETGRKGK